MANEDGDVVSWFFNTSARNVFNEDIDDELAKICEQVEGVVARLSSFDSEYNKDLCDICIQAEKDIM